MGPRATGPVTTELDARYSSEEADPASWAATLRVLQAAQLSWISTVRPNGRPHVTPLVAVWLDDAIYFHTGADEQKFTNLRANPYVVLTTGSDSWDSGLDVMVEGKAVRVMNEDTLRRLAAAWAAKWDGRWQLEVRHHGFRNPGANYWPSIAFVVRPTTVYAQAKGEPFGQTTHRF
jgi:nitroimidazol reductase NimA-like FMN-containing flavoprotein (pyridoxamine 5'-phosphate oxidase superfamily)